MENISNLREISIDENGNLILDENGDLQTSVAFQALAEHIMIRAKTFFNSSPLMPNVGSDLILYLGQPNTEEIGERVRNSMLECLTRDGFLTLEDFLVDVVPTSLETITIYIDLDPKNKYTEDKVLEFDLNLLTGEVI